MIYEIRPFGESALLVNFEQRITPEINDLVIELDGLIRQSLEGIMYTIPAYCSLTIGFDNSIMTSELLVDRIEAIMSSIPESVNHGTIQKLRIPVCYEPQFAVDTKIVEDTTGLEWGEIVSLHTNQEYRIYMLGFLAGFAYMGNLPEPLYCPRLSKPRNRVSAGSVGIAMGQTGIYPIDAPGGWNLIGKCPIPLIMNNSDSPFLFKAGQVVTFESISNSQFELISSEVQAGIFNYEKLVA